ncbi:MAG: acyltransferase [Demequinaceae bacterium]|nr:acyltransferase [Demequinaceae bacterium]
MTANVASPEARLRPEPIPALTGFRIIGAVWVMLYHFRPTIYEAAPSLRFFDPVLSRGDLGVPLFFTLSGFIIWHNYGFRSLLTFRASARFLWRRFARLWPVNFATAALSVPLVLWAVRSQGYWGAPIPDWYSVGGWLKSAFMIEQIGQPSPNFAWNQPSWSLSGEMVAYVAFPAVLALLLFTRATRLRHTWLWFALALGIAYQVMDKSFLFPSRWLVELVFIFIAGVLIRLAGLPKGRLRLVASVAQVVAPAAIVGACYSHFGQFLIALIGIWVWSLSSDSGPGAWIFSTRWAQVAGLSSYSVYMLHWVVFGYGYIALYYHPRIKASFLGEFAIFAIFAVAALSWAMWRFFETPARQSLNRLFEHVWPRRDEEPRGDGTQTVDVSTTEIIGVEDVHHHQHQATDATIPSAQ